MFYNSLATSWRYTGPPVDPAVERFHKSLPDYTITPLISLPQVARRLGLGHVLLKDESSRLGLPAFKILGASWATFKAVAAQCNMPLSTSLEELGTMAQKENITLVTCTEGNWGRAVARMAKYLQIKAVILVPDFMDEATQRKIQDEGADVVVVEGDYDFSIAKAREMAENGGLLIMGAYPNTATFLVANFDAKDVAWVGYEEVPEVNYTAKLLGNWG